MRDFALKIVRSRHRRFQPDSLRLVLFLLWKSAPFDSLFSIGFGVVFVNADQRGSIHIIFITIV